MGSTIWVELHGRPLKETADDCSKMKRLADELDDLAVRLGVDRLSDFFDYTEMARQADAEMEAWEIREGRREDVEVEPHEPTAESVAERAATGDWFDSARGLATVRALAAHLEKRPDALKFPTHPSDVGRYRSELMGELRLCETLLAGVAAGGRRFRFLLVP